MACIITYAGVGPNAQGNHILFNKTKSSEIFGLEIGVSL
jgi:hypothetical protein